MKVLLANPRGFCAGVNMAISVLNQVLELVPDRPVYVYHEIVHNKHVVQHFTDSGVVFVDDMADIPLGALVVYSAHGVSPAIRKLAASRNLQTIDATCPLVARVHLEAIRYARQGFQIILIGHRNHDEVMGTIGEAPDSIFIVETIADIPDLKINDPDKLVYLTQTTLSVRDADVIIKQLRKAFPNITSPPGEDICYATTNRQQAVQLLAPKCDLVLIVGSRNSSNSQRLTEIAESCGTRAYLIDDKSELDDEIVSGAETVLLSAGASAPENLVRSILDEFITRYGATIQQCDVVEEHVEFGMPIELKTLARERGTDICTDNNNNSNIYDDTDKWLLQRGAAATPVRITVSRSNEVDKR